MERFCVITNYEKDKDFEKTKQIGDYLLLHGKKCVFAARQEDLPYRSGSCRSIYDVPEDTECAIVLGGDGTIIQAADALAESEIPLFGINLGTLGFLAEIEKPDILDALDQLMEDHYSIEKRMMLQGKVISECTPLYKKNALNDIVITRSGFSRLISLKIFVNDELVNTYLGDGVIIATPTGSTGYNLSAGGPVITPYSNGMVITPVCPHTLSARSIVVSSHDRISVEVERTKKTQEEEAIATFDGMMGGKLKEKDRIEIKKASVETKLIKLSNPGFFEILRNKLGQN